MTPIRLTFSSNGQTIKLLVDPPRLLVWNYLQTFSRPQAKDEELAYRVASSRYFKALHPKVKLPQPANISSCVTCHPARLNTISASLPPSAKTLRSEDLS